MTDTAILICGHGSRDTEAVAEFAALATGLRQRRPDVKVGYGFLEFARPMIREGLDALTAAGARRILAQPAMLFAAGHVKNDLPWEINSYIAEHPEIAIEYGRDLAVDLKLLAAARARIEAAERTARSEASRAETLLLVVGRGTNDPDANSNVAKVTRMLWEGLRVGWAETAFSGVTDPRVDAALERVVRLGFRRIIVFPYFLFTGVLVKRIYAQADAAAAAHPDVEIVKAPYLNDHPLVLDALAERIDEIGAGQNVMNCRLCKYRAQAIGYEADVGAVQAGHHLHVRGIGTDADHHHHGHHHHHHDHDHGHGHAHDHHGHHHHHGNGREPPTR
jgi:sirohydrochlorin cobaltochelatase